MMEQKEVPQHVLNVLNSFSKKTRIRENIGQKYLAIHQPKQVYDMISSDFDAISLRVPATEKWTSIDAETFVYLTQQVLSCDFPVNTTLDSFVRTVFPRQAGEEAWRDATRKDKWKERASLLALRYKDQPAQFTSIMKQLYPDSWISVKKKALAYAGPFQEKDIGKLLACPSLRHMDESILECDTPKPVQIDIEVVVVEEEEAKRSIKLTSQATKSEISIESLRPKMESYRVRNMLPPTMRTFTLASKMVSDFASLSDQNEIDTALAIVDAQEWKPNVDTTNANVVAIASICNKYNWEPRELEKTTMCPKRYLTEREYKRFVQQSK